MYVTSVDQHENLNFINDIKMAITHMRSWRHQKKIYFLNFKFANFANLHTYTISFELLDLFVYVF